MEDHGSIGNAVHPSPLPVAPLHPGPDAVLTIHTLRPGRWRYYVDDLVPGRAEGTRVAGESPGRWVGGATIPLGLEGRVEAGALATVLAGRAPSGAELRRRPAGTGSTRREVGGFDLTFGAPKSVSVLALLGPADVGAHALAGHASAVEASWRWLERTALGARRRVDGTALRLTTTGFVAAEFLHRTSRALDPHVHTHLVVANVVHGADGRWSTLDSRRLHRHLPTAQALYHAHLRFELAHRLGVAWEASGRDRAEVVGVDPVLCGALSQRSGEVAAWLHERGSPATARRRWVAATVTRPDKDRTVTVEDLSDRWAERAALVGRPPRDLALAVGRAMAPGSAPLPGTLDLGVLSDRLAERAEAGPAVGPLELVADLAAATPAGAEVPVVVGWAQHAARALEGTSLPGRGTVRWPLPGVARAVEDMVTARVPSAGRTASGDADMALGRVLTPSGGPGEGRPPGPTRHRWAGPVPELGR